MTSSRGRALRGLLKEQLVIPGVYDALGARIAQRAGFGAMFQTGYGTSASLLGMPDYGFVGAAETVDNARRICGAVQAPVIVDADTGYGGPLGVWRLTRDLEDAGAAGMFLEDQRWPKRCGHMRGKEVVPQEEYAEKLGAAVDARRDADFVIVARTDSRATEGLDSAIERSKENLRTGADAVFIEAPGSAGEMERIGREIDAPLVANMIEGGATPLLSAGRLAGMGFGIVLYPLSALYAGAFAMAGVLEELRRSGGTEAYTDRMLTFEGFNELVGLGDLRDMEKRLSGNGRGSL